MSDIKATFIADFDTFKASADSAAVALKTVEAGGTKLAANFDQMTAASDRTAPKVHNLRSALTSFDGALAAVGLNIGTEVRALNEFGDAVGKTAGELGAIATVGLSVSTLFASFQITSAILQFTGLDKAIGDLTVKMFDFGVDAEIAGAKQDTINKAVRDGANANISYSDAITFNTVALHQQRDELKAYAGELRDDLAFFKKWQEEQARWAVIMAELNTAGVNWLATLQGINGEVVEAVKFYLNAGVAQGTLATAYGLTAVQIKAISTAMSEELAMAKVLADFSASAAAHQATLDARAMAAIEAHTKAIRDAATAAEQFNADFLAGALKDAQAQDVLNGIAAQMPPVIDKMASSFAGATQAAGIYMNQLSMLVTDPNTAGFFGTNGVGATLYGGGNSGLTPEEAAYLAAGGFIHGPSNAGGGGMPHMAAGGPVSAGRSYMVGERGPELYTPSASGFITPNGGGGMAVTVNITQPFGTPDAIAKAVREALVTYQRNRAGL